MKTVLVWDFPLRLFHWLLVVLVLGSVVTGQIGGNLMEWHGRFGLAIAGLLGFRLTWGVVGSTYARFWTFIRGPRTILAYLRGEWMGLGHNPLGALSVAALLATLIFQVTTGLFGNDDIAFNGPLYPLIDKDTSDVAIGWHKTSIWLLAALVLAHLCAILFYIGIKKETLIRPMINGRKAVPDALARPATGGGLVALIVSVAVATGVVWVAAGGLNPPPPPPPPPGSTFNW